MAKGAEIFFRYLPEVFYSSSNELRSNADIGLTVLLEAFAEILFASSEEGEKGLERIIDDLPNLFDPGIHTEQASLLDKQTPDSFLRWLSEWVALGKLQNISKERNRELISQIIPLYSCRGTKLYLEKLLEFFFPNMQVLIDDKELPTFRIGHSFVSKTTRLGGDIPFCFFVELRLKVEENNRKESRELLKQVHSVIDLAKPAHTFYQLECYF